MSTDLNRRQNCFHLENIEWSVVGLSAIQIYEQVAASSLESSLLKYSAKARQSHTARLSVNSLSLVEPGKGGGG